MKYFLCKLAIWIVAIYTLAWLLDYVISEGQTKISGYPQQTWREIRRSTFDCDGIIMGTSRGLEHYNPLIIDSITGHSFYNLGMGGYQANVELMKYRCYTYHNPLPKYVIWDVDYIMMNICTAKHDHQSEQYLPLIYDNIMRPELRHVGYSFWDIYFPLVRWYGYQTHIKRGVFDFFHIQHHTEYASYKGFTPDPGTWDIANLCFTDSVSGLLNDSAKTLFEEQLSIWQKDGVKVILVNSPKYYKLIRMNQNPNIEQHYFDSISRTYDIPYFNYSTPNYWLCTDSTKFNAGVHLTAEGADIFSAEIANDLIKKHVLDD